MAQVEGEQKEPKNIKARHKITFETVNHHRIDIVMAERIRLKQRKACVGDSHGKMCEVISDKCQHNQPAHHHVTRGERCFRVLPVDVRLGSGATIFDRQLDRYINVNDDSQEQENADRPQQRAEIAQVLRVTINPIWS